MQHWIVSEGVLSRRDADGRPADLTVRGILKTLKAEGFLAVEGGERVTAARWVLAPRLVSAVVDGRAVLIAEASGGGVAIGNLSSSALAAGHVTSGRRWFALDEDVSRLVRERMSIAAATIGPLTLRQLLSLRAQPRDELLYEDRIEEVTPELFGDVTADDIAPVGVQATLYPYQTIGWRWLRFLARHELGGLLADEMGLGKTLQVIALLADPGTSPLRPTLIVAPGTLLENWRRELSKFAPALRVAVHAGPKRTGSPRELIDADVVITAYDTVVRDVGLFGAAKWSAVVLDEAQAIRNPDTARAAAICSLNRERSYAVTGTPLENRLLDLWSVMSFVAPGHLGTRREFDSRFSDDEHGGAQLEPLISPLMLRRRVAEVAKDLPERIDVDVPLLMSEADARLYDELRQSALSEHGAVGPLVAMTKLRMFCAHPSAAGSDAGRAEDFPKLARLLEILEEIATSGEKAIVFCAFTEVSDLIAAAIRKHLGLWVDQLDGRVATERRQAVVDAFSAQNGSAALILNPRVGGAGLNITAATHVIHYGLEWNPALEAQASARAWRRGQDRPVTIHRLFFAGTVEEVMNDRLARKRALGEAAVVGIEGSEEDRRDALAALSISPMLGG